MRINYTMFGTRLTGGVRVILEIANGLQKRGHNVTITSLGSIKDHAWFPLKTKTNYVNFSYLKNGTLFGLDKIFKSNLHVNYNIENLSRNIPDCDINIATFCFTAYSVFRANKGVSFYHMQHYEPLFFDDPYLQKIAEETYFLPLNKIANSIWLQQQMKERYGFNPTIINPAIDHSIFYPRKVNSDSNTLKILCFAKEARWKGFFNALQAMELVKKQRDDVEFLAYGMVKPSYPTKIPYRFINAPSDEELAHLYSSVDLVICPSWYESFPLPPLEAMACGAPVITTPYGTEDYAFHEKNCLVVPPKDPKVLAESILSLLVNEQQREQFAKEGPKTAKMFTWERTLDKVDNLFHNTLKV